MLEIQEMLAKMFFGGLFVGTGLGVFITSLICYIGLKIEEKKADE